MVVYNMLKQRVISAVIGICILFAVLALYKTIILNIAIAIVSAMAVYELLLATKYVRNKVLATTSLAFSISIPFFSTSMGYHLIVPICTVFVFILFMLMLIMHQIIRIEQISLAFFISVIASIAFSTIIYIRDRFEYAPQIALFYILMGLSSAWISDTGAYFTGMLCGRHKLAPQISPNKTIEGAIGGVILSTASIICLALFFSHMFNKIGLNVSVNYIKLLIVAPIASVLGILGDLSASLVKRQCLIKDFGIIMPGHGGVLDRFDSVLFTVPFYYLIVLFFPIVS